MSDAVITVENLGKKYRLRHQAEGQRYVALRDLIAQQMKAPLRFLCKLKNNGNSAPAANSQLATTHGPTREDFWALRDVSFEVKRGDVVGIVGRNGAGKSTLLKILSRITEPTTGRITIDGRVASLLEVGTGFHPELTGRENIFLNGAILGMTKAEIKRKFDEIVAFSEVEKFLDTPVKHYSSGMYVRLAFAVAAHLEPEIMVVDEVLAVGDAEFQKKCLGRMQDASTKEGRTVLFVSHNMAAVSKLCGRAILLDAGRIRLAGTTEAVLPHYLKVGTRSDGIRTWQTSNNGPLAIRALRILAPDGMTTGHVDIRHPFTIKVDYSVLQSIPRFRIALRFFTPDGTIAFTASDSADPSFETKPTGVGNYTTRCFVPGYLLNEGFYSLTLSADIPFEKGLFVEESALGFSVEQTGGVNARFAEKWPGVVCPRLEWRTEPVGISNSRLS